MAKERSISFRFDVPNSARVWNYWMGGKDNYEVDRAAGDAWAAVHPEIFTIAKEARRFLIRVVRFLAGEVGISQFLDIGTGLPTMQNTHEVAQGIIPNSRIVYVDNDPIVLTYARALLTNTTSEGITTYINANLHDPEQIITAARNVLNFSQPVAVIISDILGHIADYDEARSIVSTLVEAVPSGSYLAVQDGTNTSTGAREAAARYAKTGALPYIMRPPGQVAGYLHGLERVEPGVVTVTGWRPQANHVARPRPTDQYGGVARKP